MVGIMQTTKLLFRTVFNTPYGTHVGAVVCTRISDTPFHMSRFLTILNDKLNGIGRGQKWSNRTSGAGPVAIGCHILLPLPPCKCDVALNSLTVVSPRFLPDKQLLFGETKLSLFEWQLVTKFDIQ